MITRRKLEAKRRKNFDKIEVLKKENIELSRQLYLLSDKVQQFTEVEADVRLSRRDKKTVKQLVGRVHWKEDFVDEDTGEVVTIERHKIVRINGEWV